MAEVPDVPSDSNVILEAFSVSRASKYDVQVDGTLSIICEFFNASGFLGEAKWTDNVDADWHTLISAWILENQGDKLGRRSPNQRE